MITLTRVPYGKKNIPEDLREYQLNGSGPVGTLLEWKSQFPGNEFKLIEREYCCICKKAIIGFGNNPQPYKKKGICCDRCNVMFVIPCRLEKMKGGKKE